MCCLAWLVILRTGVGWEAVTGMQAWFTSRKDSHLSGTVCLQKQSAQVWPTLLESWVDNLSGNAKEGRGGLQQSEEVGTSDLRVFFLTLCLRKVWKEGRCSKGSYAPSSLVTWISAVYTECRPLVTQPLYCQVSRGQPVRLTMGSWTFMSTRHEWVLLHSQSARSTRYPTVSHPENRTDLGCQGLWHLLLPPLIRSGHLTHCMWLVSAFHQGCGMSWSELRRGRGN